MRTVGGALRRTGWLGPAAVVLVVACGGDPFVFGGDAGSDALLPPKSLDVPCGPQPACSLGAVPPNSCCASATNTERCTGGSCNCDTQLECASDANCPSDKAFCCIDSTVNTDCSNPMNLVFHAHCVTAPECVDPLVHMCNPASAIPCLPTRTCATDANTLQKYLLPPGQGFGVCQ